MGRRPSSATVALLSFALLFVYGLSLGLLIRWALDDALSRAAQNNVSWASQIQGP